MMVALNVSPLLALGRAGKWKQIPVFPFTWSPGIGLQGGHEWIRSTFNPQAEKYDWLLIYLGRQQGLHILKSICQGLEQVSQDRNECE